MALITYFVVQPYERTGRGAIDPMPAVLAQNADHARRLARRLARQYVGAIAFSRAGDPDLGDYDDAIILQVCGQVPRETLDAARAA